MNRTMMKNIIIAIVIMSLAALFVSCAALNGTGSSEKTGTGEKSQEAGVYYLTQDESQIVFESGHGLSADSGISDLILALQENPEDIKLKGTVGSEIKLIDYRRDENGAVLNFEDRYYEMSPNTEVLFRAAAAKTLLQDSSINYVVFEVNGSPLLYKNGEEVGSMTRETFIDNAGDELSSYVKKKVKLFFADESGTSLVSTEKVLIYSSNEFLEKVVAEELISGPGEGEGYATISPDTRLNTVVLKNGTCYVSFDAALVDKPIDVTEETLLYSIVNSLCSLPGVSKVRISVNGETDRFLRSTYRLDETYSYNEEMVSGG